MINFVILLFIIIIRTDFQRNIHTEGLQGKAKNGIPFLF